MKIFHLPLKIFVSLKIFKEFAIFEDIQRICNLRRSLKNFWIKEDSLYSSSVYFQKLKNLCIRLRSIFNLRCNTAVWHHLNCFQYVQICHWALGEGVLKSHRIATQFFGGDLKQGRILSVEKIKSHGWGIVIQSNLSPDKCLAISLCTKHITCLFVICQEKKLK